MPNQPSIKVSLPGKSIESDDFVNDFVFVGNKPSFHVKERLQLSLTTSGVTGQGSNSFFHNFGYIPQIIAFVTTRTGTQHPNTYINVPGSWADNVLESPERSTEVFDCYADENYVYITAFAQTFIPAVSTTPVAATYHFDILLGMEEALLQ